MLNKANLQDRAFLATWSEKVSWSSIITPIFLAVFEGVMVDVPNWMVKLWWNNGFDGTTSSSVLARLSWRWWSFIQQEMSVRQAEMWAAIVRSSGWNSSDKKSHVSEWQNLVMTYRQIREVVQELSTEARLRLDVATWTPHLSKIPWRTNLIGKTQTNWVEEDLVVNRVKSSGQIQQDKYWRFGIHSC